MSSFKNERMFLSSRRRKGNRGKGVESREDNVFCDVFALWSESGSGGAVRLSRSGSEDPSLISDPESGENKEKKTEVFEMSEESAKKAVETRKANIEKQRERERINLRIRESMRTALLAVLEDKSASHEQKLQAARLIQPLM